MTTTTRTTISFCFNSFRWFFTFICFRSRITIKNTIFTSTTTMFLLFFTISHLILLQRLITENMNPFTTITTFQTIFVTFFHTHSLHTYSTIQVFFIILITFLTTSYHLFTYLKMFPTTIYTQLTFTTSTFLTSKTNKLLGFFFTQRLMNHRIRTSQMTIQTTFRTTIKRICF